MTWVDLVVIAVLIVSALLAFLRGLVREALGIVAWLAAAYVAMSFSQSAIGLTRTYIENPDIADPVGIGLVFVVALIVFSIVASLLARLVRRSALGSLDRTLGLVYGLVRGAALVVAAYIAMGAVAPVERWPAPVQQARFLPLAYAGATWVVAQLPGGYRPHVQAPPAGRDASADALSRTEPQGYALSGRGGATRQ